MRVLVNNMVKTETADYPCATRDEAEALFMALREIRGPDREERTEGIRSTQQERKRPSTGRKSG